MMRKSNRSSLFSGALALLLCLGLAFGCGDGENSAQDAGIDAGQDAGNDAGTDAGQDAGEDAVEDAGPGRNYQLGFTPFPYDVSVESALWVYDHMAENADVIAHHFDNGIPWPEALAGEDYHANMMGDWTFRRDTTPEDADIYLALTPINLGRDSLAAYRAEAEDMPLPAPWDGYAFDHPDVKAAYVNHCVRAIEFFGPRYLAIGIEANLLLNNTPESWDAYVELNRHTYTALKALYPDLPIFTSLYATSFLEGWRSEDDHAAQLQALEAIIAYSDFFAWALYPYASAYTTNELPQSMFADLFALSDKPVVISETGYPADTFDILDGAIVFEGTEEKQRAYIDWLLDECEAHGVRFVINFVLRDYDDLCWSVFPEDGCPDGWISWRDTGLYAEDGTERPALLRWREALALPLRSP